MGGRTEKGKEWKGGRKEGTKDGKRERGKEERRRGGEEERRRGASEAWKEGDVIVRVSTHLLGRIEG